MPVILYRGKHKKKLRKLAPVTQASRENNKGIAIFPALPRPEERTSTD